MAKSNKNLKKNKLNSVENDIGASSKKRKESEDKLRKENTGLKFLLFFVILVIIGLSIGILFSSEFNLSNVLVDDGINITKEEIRNAIDVTYGENILKQNYGELKSDIESLPYIESVKLSIKFPNTIKIEYTERVPYALIKFLESYFVVDKFGYLLEIKKTNEGIDLPVIYGFDVSEYELGEKLLDISGVKMKNVVMLMETAKQRKFKYKIVEISYEEIGQVKLWFEGHEIEIIYGQIDKNLITEKLKYLERILEDLKGKNGRLDISSDNYREKSIFVDVNNL